MRFFARLLALGAAGVLAIPGGARAALPVPITVQETLPSGATGASRTSGPVTVGVPLEESAGITSVAQLGLSGATAGQFRELARWPGGGIRWVLVDFQSDLAAGGTSAGVSLTSGGGNFGGANLAVDQGASIQIATGPATFTIRKSPFRFFDQVAVGATPLVTTGSDGVVAIDPAGTRFTSANDAAPTVVIEENGPVRAVVRASGMLKSGTGVRLCEYLVRLHFYRGKSHARAWVSLRNARAATPTTFTFRSAEVVVPLTLGTGPRFATATSRGNAGDPLAVTETAYLFQAYSTRMGAYENAYANAPMDHSGSTFNQSGVEVRKVGGTVYQALSGNPADYAHGWAALEDASGRGLTLGMRWMASQWPAGFELSGNGIARVELFSKRNSKTSIKFAWGAYETRELFFDFHTSTPASRGAALAEMEYPLSGRVPVAQYAAAGAFFGERKLVSASEQQTWFSQHGGTSPSLANIVPQFWRYHAWNTGGGGNQVDFAFLGLIDYARTGNGGFLAEAERNSLYKADTSVRHSDGFDYTTNQINPGEEGSGTNQGTFNGKIFDFEHPHWISLPIAYYMTGNELFREAVVDFGEWKHALGDGQDPYYYKPIQIFGDGSMRIWSRYYRDFALLWDFTGDSRYWNDINEMTTKLLASRDVPGSALPAGRNLERGYMYLAHGDYTLPRGISDFMTVQIHFEAAWEALRMLRAAQDPRVEAMEDYLLGLADFIYNEFYFETGSAETQYGYLYRYHLDVANSATTNSYWSEGFRPIASSRPLGFAFQMTGDSRYLTRAAKLLIGDVSFVTNRTPSDIASQSLMAADLFRPPGGWFVVPGVTTTSLGGGSYRLDWTVPPGTTGYRIKSADRAIVSWLGFDQATRAYRYPPATNVAWYAAGDVAGEPAPATPGSSQSVTLSGFDPAKTMRFMVRYSTDVRDVSPPAPPSNLMVR